MVAVVTEEQKIPQENTGVRVGYLCVYELNLEPPSVIVWADAGLFRIDTDQLPSSKPRSLTPIVFRTEWTSGTPYGPDSHATNQAQFVDVLLQGKDYGGACAPAIVGRFTPAHSANMLLFQWNPNGVFRQSIKTVIFTDTLPEITLKHHARVMRAFFFF